MYVQNDDAYMASAIDLTNNFRARSVMEYFKFQSHIEHYDVNVRIIRMHPDHVVIV